MRSRFVAAMIRALTARSRVAPDRAHRTALQHMKQLRLQPDGHFADLIEEQGPPVRFREQSRAVGRCASKGAPNVAEKLAFEKRLRDGGAVHLNEGRAAPAALGVEGACDHDLCRFRFRR